MNDARVIADQAALAPLLEDMRQSDRIAVDTEFVPEYTYFPHLCLVQIATERSLAAIDALALDDLSEFWEALVRPDCEIVLHAGKEELQFCAREAGAFPQRVFDVQLAAGLVGLGYPLSYSKLVQRVLDRDLSGGETRTDWRRRPLSRKQIDYALDDVRHLLEVRDALDKRLSSMQREDWFAEETVAYLSRLSAYGHPERWRKVSGAGSLSSRQSAVLREIWNWRERRAKAIDKPVRWVIRDDLMIELAKRQPRSVDEMRQTRGMGTVANARWAGDLIAAIETGRDAPVPEPIARGWRRDTVEDAMIHKVVSAAMVHLAAENHVAATLLGTNDDLRELIEWHAGPEADEEERPLLARGWRAKVCGDNLKDLLDGKVAIRLHHGPDGARLLFERV